MARADRRRRVLNEEVRAAGAASAAVRSSELPGDTPRYGEQANIENHPQITDFVPRRYRVVLLMVLACLTVSAAAEALVRYAGKLDELLPTLAMTETFERLAAGLVAWSSAVVLLVAAAFARAIFMLRRHRVDDYRGRYRMWRLASWLAVALSANAVVGLHEPVARVLGQLTGWQLLAGHAGWWLGAVVLVGGWLLVRLVIDMAECRGALMATILAVGCYATAGVAIAVEWSPEWLGAWSGLPARSLPLMGHVLMLAAVMLNARYVVLDVQGLLTRRTVKSRTSSAKPKAERSANQSANAAVVASAKSNASTQWTNGSAPATGPGPKRRLSKAERKRLRKLKSRQAA